MVTVQTYTFSTGVGLVFANRTIVFFNKLRLVKKHCLWLSSLMMSLLEIINFFTVSLMDQLLNFYVLFHLTWITLNLRWFKTVKIIVTVLLLVYGSDILYILCLTEIVPIFELFFLISRVLSIHLLISRINPSAIVWNHRTNFSFSSGSTIIITHLKLNLKLIPSSRCLLWR